MLEKRENEVKLEEVEPKEFEWQVSDEGFFVVKLLEGVIKYMDSRQIQRILREVDNNNLATALKGLSRAGQDCFLNNLSARLSTMIREDMAFMGPITTASCAESATVIMGTIVDLMNKGEFVCNDTDIIRKLLELFRVDSEGASNQDDIKMLVELEELFRKYKSIRRRIIY